MSWSPQLIFEKEGVYLHTNAKRSHQDTTLPGFIRIVERVRRSPKAAQKILRCLDDDDDDDDAVFQAGVPALEWSPLEDRGRSAPAVLYSKKVGGDRFDLQSVRCKGIDCFCLDHN